MKKAFTLIELVFVIVIIGILVSITLPKLSATRNDAKHTTLMANTKICIDDLIGGYKGIGKTINIDSTPSCISAQKGGASITYTNDSVRISNVDSTLDGDHIFKGTKVSF